MGQTPAFNLGGLQLRVSPFTQPDGQLLRSVNVDSYPAGAKQKRAGYGTVFTSLAMPIDDIFSWQKDDGTTLNVYVSAGGTLFYSAQGTAALAVCGNGTFTAGQSIGNAVVNNTMVVGDGVTATRHTTDGTSFTNTALAPIAGQFTDYQGRIYAAGTGSFLFYSVTNDATNWQLSGTSDSSSILIPGPGKLTTVFKTADRIFTAKTSGVMHRWDGYNLFDICTNLGPSSIQSIGNVEDYLLWLNRAGYYSFNGASPQNISNPIQPQIYNDAGSAISGTTFNSAAGVIHKYDYYCSVGTVMDDITGETVANCIQKYNFQLNEWLDYSFANPPTAWCSYKDTSGVQQLIFGDATGQCYQYGGTALTDAGQPVEAIMEFMYSGGLPELEKEWNYAWFYFNPGCEAKVQVAVGNTFSKKSLKWADLGDVSTGVGELKFRGERGRLLFIKISDYSRNSRFTFYGMSVNYDPIVRN